MTHLTIGEVARQAGVRPSAIRYYESVGILPEPGRVNGRRRYDADILHVLRMIAVAKQAGFTISEIRTIFSGVLDGQAPSTAWEMLAQEKLRNVDQMIVRATAMRELLEAGLRCGCLRLEDCLLISQSIDGEPDSTAAGRTQPASPSAPSAGIAADVDDA